MLNTYKGQRVGLMGVTDTRFKFRVLSGGSNQDVVMQAVEDENDGYRSYLECIRLANEDGCTFFPEPIVWVTISGDDKDYWYFTDDSGHVWLTIGTDNSDDYYPCFCFHWTPPRK